MPRPTLIDIQRRRSDSMLVPILDECAIAVPELAAITAETLGATEDSFTSLTRNKRYPAAFRSFNEGNDPDKSGWATREHKCALLTPRFEADVELCKKHPKGMAGQLAEEGLFVMTDTFAHLAAAFWYGTLYHSLAFPGVKELCPTANEVDCGGTADLIQTEAFMLHIGQMGSEWVFGMAGKFDMSPPRVESVADANGKKFDAWVMTGSGRIGAMHRSPATMVRIKGISTAHPLTGAKLQEAWAKFPTSRQPNAIFTSTLGVSTLTDSRRTALITDPPLAKDWNGIPIYKTDAISTGALDSVPSFSTEVALKFKNEN